MSIKYVKIQNKEWLCEELQTKPIRTIAEENSCSSSAILYQVRKHGIIIPKRLHNIAHVNKSEAIKKSLKAKYPDGRLGKMAGHWKGGNSKTAGGHMYVHTPDHPLANHQGYVMAHRLVMEEKIDRYLTKEEIVHHIDLDKLNNAPANLFLCKDNSHHRQVHAQLERAATELIRTGQIIFKDGIYI